MTLFFLGYFLILNFPFFGVTVMPLTAMDRLIPYQSAGWMLYASLWVYVALPPSLIADRRELLRYGWMAAGVSLAGFAIFMLWPTAVPSVAVEGADSSLVRIRDLDTTGNSCPSLHVAFSVYTAVWLDRFCQQLRLAKVSRWINVLWCVGIIYSTLATKQHVFIDAVAGVALGLAGGVVQARADARKMQPVKVETAALAQINPATRKL